MYTPRYSVGVAWRKRTEETINHRQLPTYNTLNAKTSYFVWRIQWIFAHMKLFIDKRWTQIRLKNLQSWWSWWWKPIDCMCRAHTHSLTHGISAWIGIAFQNMLETAITMWNVFGQGFVLWPFVRHRAAYFSSIVTRKLRGCWRLFVIVIIIIGRHWFKTTNKYKPF